MKKLSRKNTLERKKSTGQVRQHFSFRKLNSGLLVSAAIGAFLIFDNNTAQAATVPDKGTNNVASTAVNQNSASQKLQQKEVALSANNSQSENNNTSNNNTKSEKNVDDSAKQNQKVTANSVQNSDLGEAVNQPQTMSGDSTQSKKTENSTETNKVKVADLNSESTKEDKTLTNLKASLAQKSTSLLPTPTVSDDMYVTTSNGRAEMIIDNNKVGNVEGNNNITLQLDTNGAGKYVINIPDGIYSIKTDPLDPNYGTKNVNGNSYTYDITYDGLVKIPITLTTNSNYLGEPTPLADIGETEKKITWSVDGVEQQPLTFTQTIKPEWDPQSPVRTNPNSTNVKGVPVNTNVTYTFKVNETPGVNSDGYASNIVNSAVNYGTTITIPVPDGFILDEAATKSLNGFTEQYKTTITQPNGKGTDIIIEVPKGAGKQYWNQGSIPGYQLVGRYDIPQPEKDITVSADKPITIVQKLGDGADAQTMEATVPSFTDTIIGKETSIPLGDFSPTIAEAYGGSNNILPVTKNDIVVNYFGFTNSTIFSYNDDMKIKVDFPDGLTVNKISTPHTSDNLPGTTSYAYTLTLTDGTILSGTVAAGESVSVPEGGNIQSAVFTPNEVAIGAQTAALPANDLRSQDTSVNAFITYGHANEKYQNGDAVPNGAQLETTVSMSSTATGDKTWIAKQSQQVVLPENLTSYLNTYGYQGTTASGQTKSGYLAVYYGTSNATTLNIYEPIFYYVIPATTNITSPLSLQVPNVNGDFTATPKVTSFLADDGRTVVKIDYTGTKYYFNAGMNANTEVALNNNADATNGSSPWDIYVVSSTTKLLNTEYSDSTKNNFSTNSAANPFDTSWVQGNVNNLYHLGGGTWTIQQIAGITTAPMIKGNQNPDYTNQGSSNDKGSPKMDISVSIPNGLTSSVANGNAYISVPQTSLGSGFDFELSGPATFEKYPGDVQAPYTVTYSDESFDLYSGSEPNADAFKTENQVTDWSKIKTIKVAIPNLAPNTTLGRIIIPGTDPTIAEDAQKNGYVQTSLYIPEFATYTNKATKLPSISFNGTAKITSRYSYVDQDGTTKIIDIPDLTYNLNDNQATMPTEAQILSNLTAADKALIPNGYVIGSVQLIGPTEKSWQTDAPMGTPEFGQQVKYYYNNAVVQYNLVKRYSTETSTKDVTRTINYVDKTTNTAMPTDLVKGQTQTVTLTQVAVKNDAGEGIGYNTSGTWNNGVYTPSTDTNGQIKVDVTDAANSWMNGSNAKWAAVINPDLTVDGYKGPFKEDGTTAYPTIAEEEVNGSTTDSNITVYYSENTIDVPPTDPKNPGDPITGTNKDYPNGVAKDDLNKTITRTINVIDANGQTAGQEVQTVKYTRTATVNVVTGDVKYSEWTAENNDWAAYAPTLQNGEGIQAILAANGQTYSNVTKDGDTLTGIGSYTVPTTDTKDNDETVNIYLNKVITLNGTRTITYKTYDHNSQLTDTTVDNSQKVTLTGSQTFDPAANKVVYLFDQTSATYPSLKVPVKTGYYASASDITAKTVSINNSDPIHSNLDDSITVNYYPMGELIQVDQDGNQIEGTTPVIYPNDPNDATKAGEVTVPAAPDGWVIVDLEKGNPFTPTDPGHDTKIYYEKLDKVSENEKQVTRTITYIDKDTGKAIPTSVVTPPEVQKATQYQFKVYDADGTTLLGYNTQGTWDENGNYIPSTQRNGQYKVDTTDEAESWIVKPGTNFPELTNPDLKEYGYSGPFEADGTTPYPTVNKVEVTGKTTNSEVKVYYTEDVVTVPPTEPHQPGEPITGTKKDYPDGVKESDLDKTITRTIKIVDADGNLVGDPIVQKVTYSRTAKVNVVTGHVDYEDWTSDKKKWDSYVPTLQTGEGIQTIIDGNGQPYSNLTKNSNVITGVGAQDITYSATDKDDQTVIIYLNKAVSFTGTRTITYSFYDKDGQKTSTEDGEPQTVTVLGNQTFDPATNKVVYTFENPSVTYPAVNAPVKTGYYASTSAISDDTVSINQTNPQNSDLNATANVDYYPMGEVIQVDRDGNQIPGTTPVTYPNDPTDPTKAGEVTVPKAPEGWVIVTPSDGDPFTPTDPDKDTKVVYEKLNEVTENIKEVTRTINYVDKTTGQPMPTNFAPTVEQKVTLTQYIVKDASGNVLGYNTTGTWEGNKYTPSTEDNGQIKVDTTDENQSWMNSTNAEWAAVTNPNLAIAGYSGPFEADETTPYPIIAEEAITGTTEDSTLTVYYTEDTVTVPPTEPHKPGEPIGDTHKQYPKGVEENDLNKTITRTINVYDADGNVVGEPVLQTVKYSRTATVNVVTGDVKYSEWTAENDKANWNEYVPTLQTGEGIQTILENGQAYDHVTKDGDKLTGVDKFNVPAPDVNTGDTIKNQTVSIYLNKKVTFNGTRTITYITHEKDGQTSSTETKQNVTVSGIQSYDPASGKVVYTFENPSATYGVEKVPVKAGYYALTSQVGEETKTISETNPQDSDLNTTATVDYYPMGNVIQVDGDGNPIPGTTPVPYPNDPSDPTKAGKVPVPPTPKGWKIVTSVDGDSFIPDKPGENTPIEYEPIIDKTTESKDITRTINVYDSEGNQVGQLVLQTVTYTRTVETNEATGKVTNGDWIAQKSEWDSYAPELQNGEGIQSILENGQAYAHVTKDGDKLTGVAKFNVPAPDVHTGDTIKNQTVSIYLNKVVSFTGTRTITYITHEKDDQTSSTETKQTVTVSGIQSYDPTSKKIVYTFENPSATYGVVNVPVKDGYYASASQVGEETKSISETNPQDSDLNAQATVDYYPMGKVIQVDVDGNQISGTTPVPYPNDPDDPTKAGRVTVPPAPEGWVIVTPSDGNPFTPTDPGEDKKIVYEKLDQVTENTKEVTRTINYVDTTTGQPMPTNLAPTVEQSVTLKQYIVKDANGKVLGYNTSGTWEDGKYTPSKEADGQIKVDTTDEAKSWMNGSNKNFDKVTNPNLTVDGYSGPFDNEDKDYPTVAEVTVNSETPDKTLITIYYKENTVTVPPDKPIVPGDDGKIPNIPGTNIPYPNGVSDSDLNKTITRTINVYDSAGKLVGTSVVQEVKYSRIATVNVVTGDVKYSDWTAENGKGNWDEYAPTLQTGEGIQTITDASGNTYTNVITDGGKIIGIGAQDISNTAIAKDNDETVNIYLNKEVTFTGTRTITYNTYNHDNKLIDSKDSSQHVSITGVQTYDPAKKQVVYTFDSPSATYSTEKVPVKDGYYASANEVESKTVTIDSSDPVHSNLNDRATVNYYPMGQLIQVDGDGNQIPGTTPVTYPNDPSDPTKAGEVTVPHTPEGWVIVTPSDGNSITPANPGLNTKIYYEKLDDAVPAYRTINRTITYVDLNTGMAMPSDVISPVIQRVTLTQYAVKDTSGKVLGYNTSGIWEANGKYVPSKEVNGQIKVDTTNVNESWMNGSGANFEKVINKSLTVDGYSGPFEENGKTPYSEVSEEKVTGKTTNSEVFVYYTEDTIIVPPTDPKVPSDKIPNTNIPYPNGVSDSDLNKSITRSINVYDASGRLVVTPVIQTVKYSRSATVNVVTGEVIYTDWAADKESNGNWNSYTPQLQAGEGIQEVTDGKGQTYANVTRDGNKITGIGEQAITFTATDKDDQIVNIYLNKEVTFTGTRTITYNTYDLDNKLIESKDSSQPISITGSQTYDPTKKQVVYTFINPNATYPSVKVAVKDGYYASASEIESKTVTIDSSDPVHSKLDDHVTVNYHPMGEVIQVDGDGNQIPGTTPTPYPNDPDNPTKAGKVTVPPAPEGWVIVTPSDGNPFIPTDPGVDKKVIYERIDNIVPNTKQITRTINYVDQTSGKSMPTDLVSTVIQKATLTQYVVKDASGKVLGYNTSGTWTDGKYTPSKETNGQIKVDTTNEADSWMNGSAEKFKEVTNPNLSVDGYDGPFTKKGSDYQTIDEEAVTGTTESSTVTVYYTEATVKVPPTSPQTPGKPIEGTNKDYPDGVKDSDLNKTITRTINVYDANGNIVGKSVVQTVKYSRSATINVVSGEVTYTDWAADKDSNGNWNSYAPQLQAGEGIQEVTDGKGETYVNVTRDGNKITGIGAQDISNTATAKDNDETVNIYLNKEVTFTGTRTITYITHEKDGQTSSTETKQNVTVSGIQSYDPASKKIVYTFENPSTTYGVVNVPVKAGYYALAKAVDKKDVSINKDNPQDSDLNAQATVDYYPMGEVIQVDGDGNPIPGTIPVPYPNDPSDPTKAGKVPVPPAPKGWKIITSVDGGSIIPDKPGEDTPIKYEPIIDESTESKEVTRKIVVTIPDGKTNTITQTTTVTRTVTTNEVTGATEYGEWSKADFPDFVPDKIDGYTTLIDGKEGELVTAIPVTFKDGMPEDGVTVYVTYREIPVTPPTNPTEPSKPEKPTNPAEPNMPERPTKPNKPSKPGKPGKPNVEKPSKDHNFTTGPIGGDNLSQVDNGKNYLSQPKAVSGNGKQKLPQTGNKDNSVLAKVLGLGSILGALITFSWTSKKRRKKDEK